MNYSTRTNNAGGTRPSVAHFNHFADALVTEEPEGETEIFDPLHRFSHWTVAMDVNGDDGEVMCVRHTPLLSLKNGGKVMGGAMAVWTPETIDEPTIIAPPPAPPSASTKTMSIKDWLADVCAKARDAMSRTSSPGKTGKGIEVVVVVSEFAKYAPGYYYYRPTATVNGDQDPVDPAAEPSKEETRARLHAAIDDIYPEEDPQQVPIVRINNSGHTTDASDSSSGEESGHNSDDESADELRLSESSQNSDPALMDDTANSVAGVSENDIVPSTGAEVVDSPAAVHDAVLAAVPVAIPAVVKHDSLDGCGTVVDCDSPDSVIELEVEGGYVADPVLVDDVPTAAVPEPERDDSIGSCCYDPVLVNEPSVDEKSGPSNEFNGSWPQPQEAAGLPPTVTWAGTIDLSSPAVRALALGLTTLKLGMERRSLHDGADFNADGEEYRRTVRHGKLDCSTTLCALHR